MRPEIAKHVGKENTMRRYICWTLNQEKKDMLTHLSIMGEDAIDVGKDVFKVESSRYVKLCNRLRANLE